MIAQLWHRSSGTANWLQPQLAPSENGSGLDRIRPSIPYGQSYFIWQGRLCGEVVGTDRVYSTEIHLSESPGECEGSSWRERWRHCGGRGGSSSLVSFNDDLQRVRRTFAAPDRIVSGKLDSSVLNCTLYNPYCIM